MTEMLNDEDEIKEIDHAIFVGIRQWVARRLLVETACNDDEVEDINPSVEVGVGIGRSGDAEVCPKRSITV